jgi:hypothetical protein
MQPMRLFSALAGLVAIGLSSGAALAQAPLCGVDVDDSPLDDFVMSGWGCSQSVVDDMWDRFEFHQDDWDDGFGYDDPCNTGKPLARTFNALALLHYSHTRTPNCAGGGGNFLDWVGCWAGDSIEELEGRCVCEKGDPGAFAYTQWGWFSEWTQLSKFFFYSEDVLERASTIVHEAKHAEDWCDHDERNCCLNGVSCDSDFWHACNGGSGPDAFQVAFLIWYARTANWPTENAYETLAAMKTRASELANARLADRFCTDPCFRVDSTGKSYHTCFQEDWHGNDPWAQIVGIDMPFASGSSVAGYTTTFTTPQAQHVVFVGADSDVHELVFTDHWDYNDLTQLVIQGSHTFPPPADLGSSVAAYVFTSSEPKQEHVVYISGDGHVNELMFAGETGGWGPVWRWKDLTADSNAPPAVVTSPLTGYETTYGTGQHHINFIDAVQGHVWELFINVEDSHWQRNDLTDIARKDDGTKPPAPRTNSPLTGYAWYNAQHVNFIDADNGHVWELYFTNSWHALDLTANALAESPHATSTLTAYTSDINGNKQHVLFIDVNNHVRDLYFASSLPWLSADLSDEAGIPDVVAAPWALHGYMTTYRVPHSQYVNFVSASDNHIYELYFDQNTNWNAADLTDVAVPKATLPKVGRQLIGYQTAWDASRHVNYIDANAHISQLYRVHL